MSPTESSLHCDKPVLQFQHSFLVDRVKRLESQLCDANRERMSVALTSV